MFLLIVWAIYGDFALPSWTLGFALQGIPERATRAVSNERKANRCLRAHVIRLEV